MRSFTLLSVASLAASAAAVPLDIAGDIVERQTKPYQIRGVQDPIFHLYLQSLPGDGSPVMGPEATSEYFIIGDTIQSSNTSLYLNIGEASTSYLPLSFDATATTTAWGLEGDTIITTNGSPYGRPITRRSTCHAYVKLGGEERQRGNMVDAVSGNAQVSGRHMNGVRRDDTASSAAVHTSVLANI
ncbi:hypothetical protein V495_03427 [Pseudogymnoascus sp. VKM F-4514 (FW-929)]|nr:hypothetical protein V495_03427 [Pseudogymnoascus sp. VKM F-4514 (FW-929)]KFY58895.1 hypothetical protein V497_04611 [Pseudogymnoascus sp. VKM F-4516 (FW-969)]